MREEFILLALIVSSCINYSDTRRSGGGGRIRSSTSKGHSYTPTTNYQKRVFKCYSCDDSHLCAINPTLYAKAVLCPKGELCSIIGREIPVTNYTKSDEVKSPDRKTADTLSTPTRKLSIWRGCQSLVSEKKSQNLSSYSIYKYLCAKDLCNHGDGHLKCYECNGVGINDRCMVDPSTVAKQVVCGPNEACYVERTTIDDDSVGGPWVSRGCIVSDVVGLMKYRSNDSVAVFCRIGDLCNWMDARDIAINSTSELGSSLTSLGLTFFLTLLLCS